MKCKVCGMESGKYPLCRVCNFKKDRGEIIKCTNCGKWHYVKQPCPVYNSAFNNDKYLYDIKKTLMSKSEQDFYSVIKAAIPDGYCVFPQINLASFIDKTDDSRFHNELFRNVDFLITNKDFKPQFIIEINDQTHLTNERKERDEKVQKICEEAGIPILKLWTSYGINHEYIKGRITETLNTLPVARVHHFSQAPSSQQQTDRQITTTWAQPRTSKSGCYVATCVYGSYDCPPVWVLRRYRDYHLSNSWCGRIFVKLYYAISPSLVKHFGKYEWFVDACASVLNKVVVKLQTKGYENTPYSDKD